MRLTVVLALFGIFTVVVGGLIAVLFVRLISKFGLTHMFMLLMGGFILAFVRRCRCGLCCCLGRVFAGKGRTTQTQCKQCSGQCRIQCGFV